MHLSTLPLNQVPTKSNPPSTVQTLSTMPKEIEVGIIFANELLDNLPFDIFESKMMALGWK